MTDNNAVTEPRTHFVYQLLDDIDHVLYVGCTKHIERRLKDHRYDNSHFFHRIARITQQGPFTHRHALRLESRLIEELRPDFNSTPERRARLAEKRNWTAARVRDLCDGRAPHRVPMEEYLRFSKIATSEAEWMFPGITDSCSPHPQELTQRDSR